MFYFDHYFQCELSVTIFEHNPEYTAVGPKLQLYLYYADSLFNLQEYVYAESIYRKIIQMKKYLSKNKNAVKTSDAHVSFIGLVIKQWLKIHFQPQIDAINDVDIKYKVYLCCMKQKQRQQAIEVLQSIQARLRTPKINMALANLYRETGNERSAVAAYKEVLRETPLALEAAENLLKMGVQVRLRCFELNCCV